jgi:hypothetical protein
VAGREQSTLARSSWSSPARGVVTARVKI